MFPSVLNRSLHSLARLLRNTSRKKKGLADVAAAMRDDECCRECFTEPSRNVAASPGCKAQCFLWRVRLGLAEKTHESPDTVEGVF